MSLYRKYRPKSFEDVVGQDHVARTLANAIKNGSVGHAYLFSGPRGVGKTTLARILAMAVNCEQGSQSGNSVPCGECQSCQSIQAGNDLSVIEIDAASNRGIDEIRSLRDMTRFAPNANKWRVFIIDEIHMLTKEAFNALLKTLEEPPPRTLFIMATTELNRVPDTIVSRSQSFQLKRIKLGDIGGHLAKIAKKEKIDIAADAINFVAIAADGALRDALSLLDQLATYTSDQITVDQVREVLGIPTEKSLVDLIRFSLGGDAARVYQVIQNLHESPINISATCDELIKVCRNIVTSKFGIVQPDSDLAKALIKELGEVDHRRILGLVERLIVAKTQLRWTPVPTLPLELALVQVEGDALTVQDAPKSVPVVQKEVPKVVAKNFSTPKAHDHLEPYSKKKAEKVDRSSSLEPAPVPDVKVADLGSVWAKTVDAIRSENTPLAALLSVSKLAGLENSQGMIAVPFSFYADRINDRRNYSLILSTLRTFVGNLESLKCQVSATKTPTSPATVGGVASKIPASDVGEIETEIQSVFGTYLTSEPQHG